MMGEGGAPSTVLVGAVVPGLVNGVTALGSPVGDTTFGVGLGTNRVSMLACCHTHFFASEFARSLALKIWLASKQASKINMGQRQSSASKRVADASEDQVTLHQALLDIGGNVCKLSDVYYAPTRLAQVELATARADEADLSEVIFARIGSAHDLPTPSAAFATVARAYGIDIDPMALDERMSMPASIDECASIVRMKLFPVASKTAHVRYYLNIGMPLVACIRVPVAWLANETAKARTLTEAADYRKDTMRMACVVFKHSLKQQHFGIAFDLNNEPCVRYVKDLVFEREVRDLCLVETSTALDTGARRPRRRVRVADAKKTSQNKTADEQPTTAPDAVEPTVQPAEKIDEAKPEKNEASTQA